MLGAGVSLFLVGYDPSQFRRWIVGEDPDASPDPPQRERVKILPSDR